MQIFKLEILALKYIGTNACPAYNLIYIDYTDFGKENI